MQRSRGLAAVCRWTIFTRDLVNDVAGIHCWLTRLGASNCKKIAKTLVGRASCGN